MSFRKYYIYVKIFKGEDDDDDAYAEEIRSL